jgi:hypothetical protein
MALTYTVYWETLAPATSRTITSTSRSYTSGDLVLVLYVNEVYDGGATIANSGTAQTWTKHASTANNDDCEVVAWSCVMNTTQSMTISVTNPISNQSAAIAVIPHSGQHATPVPSGNVFSGFGATDVSQSITPTSSGSALWMIAGDWATTNSFAAIANCTINDTHASAAYTGVLIRPTTQPRTDANAFTIGETDTSGQISWIALEVQAAAGGSIVPQAMANYRMRAA